MPNSTPCVNRPAWRWTALMALSIVVTASLDAIQFPASRLLGPMAAAIVLAVGGRGVVIHRLGFVAAQGVVGILVAQTVPPSVAGTLQGHAGLMAVGVLGVSAISTLLAWGLTRCAFFPKSTALWGMTPGAATAMTVLAEAHGEDARLVAVMQYVRVVGVSLVAALVTHLWTGQTHAVAAYAVPTWASWWPPARGWSAPVCTLALALGGAILGSRLRLPGGALLVPLFLGVAWHNGAGLALDLHPWVLTAAYACIGWTIGTRFDRQILLTCLGMLPRVMVSTALLIALCAAAGAAMSRWAGIDPLTAYLATSPGGADVVAIIAASAPVDAAFVAAMQVSRMLFVMATAPLMARALSRGTRTDGH